MNIRKDYGNYLTGKRIERGLTVKKLAEKTGVPERNIDNIEREKRDFPCTSSRSIWRGWIFR